MANWTVKLPAAESFSMAPPADLGPIGQRVWRETVRVLQDMRLLTPGDRDALRIYAEAWERRAACDAELNGCETYTLSNGTIAVHPAAKRRDQAERLIRMFAANYGLTPAARKNIKPLAEEPRGIATRDRSQSPKPQAG